MNGLIWQNSHFQAHADVLQELAIQPPHVFAGAACHPFRLAAVRSPELFLDEFGSMR